MSFENGENVKKSNIFQKAYNIFYYLLSDMTLMLQLQSE